MGKHREQCKKTIIDIFKVGSIEINDLLDIVDNLNVDFIQMGKIL